MYKRQEVNGDSSVIIQGMLAQFGSRMVEDVSNQIFVQFTQSLCAKLEGNSENIKDSSQQSDNSLSGTAVAGAAIKGMAGRLIGALRKK